ncbi:hypothetical protein AGABI2DRAFT_77005 [Agaricus bisporus var. bisporus H97]|uniref:hypothetical protein n=1 Tax=Agaricus bisporus var. bisporus (strain H97 / ATCC MYA-4626 / FGSC 10389) TaxID=936046 RepID=UPI00029F568B|nr:hypothetical protein AGABI2DRAFT_77005 [Agaricus bisporus var. bisporus H97]EKV43403.1 hypothetical protein AGABI2DRAFT_77005 [Agaricus bisporus var. bisporus H97]
MRELNDLRKNPSEGIRVQTNEEDMLDVTGIIEGPEGTPYAGGYFKVKFKFTEEFPAAPPKCWFATKIFHPNVSSAGEICVNTLKKDWQSSYGIGHILVTVKCLLIYPNPESALDEEAGKLLLEDYESYCSRAKLITSVHATPRTKPVEFNENPAAETSSPPAPSESSISPPGPSTSKTPPSISTQSTASVVTVNTSSTSPPPTVPSPRLNVPVSTRKTTSPAPQPPQRKVSHTTEKESKDKDRHPSPSPLATADANVRVQNKPVAGMGVSLANNAIPTSATKAMKRAATGSATSNAEKRKKALKRL